MNEKVYYAVPALCVAALLCLLALLLEQTAALYAITSCRIYLPAYSFQHS